MAHDADRTYPTVETHEGFFAAVVSEGASPAMAEATTVVTTHLESGFLRASLLLGVLQAVAGSGPEYLALDHGRATSKARLELLRREIAHGVAGRVETAIFTTAEAQPRVVSCGRTSRPLPVDVLEPLTFLERSVLLLRPRTPRPIESFSSIAFASEPSFNAPGVAASLRMFEAAAQIFDVQRTVLQVVGSKECCQDAFDAAIDLGARQSP